MVLSWSVRSAVLGAALLLSGLVQGQVVRDAGPLSTSSIEQRNKEATQLDPYQWPTLAPGTRGTQVVLSGEFRCSSILITTQRQYGKEQLASIGRQLSSGLIPPVYRMFFRSNSDLIQLGIVLDLKNHINGNVSTYEIPIEKILKGLNSSDLPKPIGVYIERPKTGELRLAGLTAFRDIVHDSKVLSPHNDFTYRIERSYMGLYSLLVIGLCLLAAPVFGVRTFRRRREHEDGLSLDLPQINASKLSPSEQDQYALALLDELKRAQEARAAKRSPMWGYLIFILFVLSAIPGAAYVEPWLPLGWQLVLFRGVIGYMALLTGMLFVKRLLKARAFDFTSELGVETKRSLMAEAVLAGTMAATFAVLALGLPFLNSNRMVKSGLMITVITVAVAALGVMIRETFSSQRNLRDLIGEQTTKSE